jgi:hypothetical protein
MVVAAVALGIGFSTTDYAQNEIAQFERVDPPIVWDVDLPEGEYQVGDVVTARINFYFYEMPDHGQWDPVWQARFYLYKPRGFDRLASDLTAISVGSRESYEVSIEIEQTGTYVLEACVNAVTAPVDWHQPSGRGSIFSYKSGRKGSRFSVPSDESPDTGWQQVKGTSATIRIIDPDDSSMLNLPGHKARLTRSDSFVRSQENERLSMDDMLAAAGKDTILDINLTPRSNSDKLVSIMVVADLKLRVTVDEIDPIDSVSLSAPGVGQVTKLDNRTILFETDNAVNSGKVFIYSGERTYFLGTSLRR